MMAGDAITQQQGSRYWAAAMAVPPGAVYQLRGLVTHIQQWHESEGARSCSAYVRCLALLLGERPMPRAPAGRPMCALSLSLAPAHS